MAFLHEHSCECVKSELDLFTVPPTQTSVEAGQWEEVHPLTHIVESGPIEFVISGTGEEYIDLSSTLLLLKAKITNANGTAIEQDAEVAREGCVRNGDVTPDAGEGPGQVDVQHEEEIYGHVIVIVAPGGTDDVIRHMEQSL